MAALRCFAGLEAGQRVRSVFLHQPDEVAIPRGMASRGRGVKRSATTSDGLRRRPVGCTANGCGPRPSRRHCLRWSPNHGRPWPAESCASPATRLDHRRHPLDKIEQMIYFTGKRHVHGVERMPGQARIQPGVTPRHPSARRRGPRKPASPPAPSGRRPTPRPGPLRPALPRRSASGPDDASRRAPARWRCSAVRSCLATHPVRRTPAGSSRRTALRATVVSTIQTLP